MTASATVTNTVAASENLNILCPTGRPRWTHAWQVAWMPVILLADVGEIKRSARSFARLRKCYVGPAGVGLQTLPCVPRNVVDLWQARRSISARPKTDVLPGLFANDVFDLFRRQLGRTHAEGAQFD